MKRLKILEKLGTKRGKILILILMLVLLCVVTVLTNSKTRKAFLNSISGNIENANDSETIVSSADIILTKTGTGPFDSNDEPGNDSSEDNNIVRSFDQVTWTVDLTVNSRNSKNIDKSKIQIEATLPEETANLMKWNLDSMSWIKNGQVSEDGRTLTGSYLTNNSQTSSSTKQTLIFVLQVYGAPNGTEIVPTFNFNIEGNTENDKITTTGEKVLVSASGNYNIALVRNTNLNNRVTDLNYNGQAIDGKMYGYGFVLQLRNSDTSKGLKGIEYPQGDITFDIDLYLLKINSGSTNIEEAEDITNLATPLLWNYCVNYESGVIPDRNMNFGNGTSDLSTYAPLGVANDRNSSVYDSGDITMEQEGSKIKVTVKNYAFDGIFPKYNAWYSNENTVYTDNIGCFSVGYFQIIVPNNEETNEGEKDYYLALNDSNFNVRTISGENINNQVVTTDDVNIVQHVSHNQGAFYQYISLLDENLKSLNSTSDAGDAVGVKGQLFGIASYVGISTTNDSNDYIRSVDRFIKFDGNVFEPTTITYMGYDIKFEPIGMDNMTFKYWYVTKKDGTNWTSQEDMNNALIEDMALYENFEDIPDGFTCVGMYVESQGGYIEVPKDYYQQYFLIPMKIKDNAKIGTTYGFVQSSGYWREELDRNIYTQEKLDSYDTYPTPAYNIKNTNYIKTEYDENGIIVPGTNNGGGANGQTLLIVGAKLHGEIKAVDASNNEKINYDLGKNEDIVTYIVKPQLDTNNNLKTQITDVTLKAEVVLQKGLEYVSGSSKRGESSYTDPEITKNEDGTTSLVWYLYNCTTGETIEPIKFNTQIDNETVNGTQYQVGFIVSEKIGENGISKIGNSEIKRRTSVETINIINLATHRLYKEVETPIVEKNGEIKYKIIYENKTDEVVSDFQLLDILPYIGDGRGSNFSGTYTLKNVNIIQTVNNINQEINNLTLYTTNSDDVKAIDAKNEEIGTSSIWEKISTGEVNKDSKAIAIKGAVSGQTKIEIEITLQTIGNNAKDIYSNSAMAQVYSNSEQMESSIVNSMIVYRSIEGKVWQDSNYNGLIDEGEKYLSEVTLKLVDTSNNQEVASTKTNENGEYKFENLNRGKYKVKIEINNTLYDLTEKEVGTNVEKNSKFNKDTKETDEITKLDSIQSPILIETNVNAGVIIKKINIQVTKVWEDNPEQLSKRPEVITINVIGENNKLVQSYDLKVKEGEMSHTFMNLPKCDDSGNEINYRVEEQEKNINDLKFYTSSISGNVEEGYTITNTFTVPDEKTKVTVNKVWKDNSIQQNRRPEVVTINVIGENNKIVQSYDLKVKEGETSHTFTDLPKYNSLGNEINYRVEEQEKNMDDLKFYISNVSGNIENGYTITNTFTKPKDTVNIIANKVWNDNEEQANRRPESIILVVKNGDEEVQSKEVNSSNLVSGTTNKWSVEFTGLDRYDENGQEIKYTIEEKEKNPGDLHFYQVQENNVAVEDNQGTIRNNFVKPKDKISVTVTKNWNDNNNVNGRRPESVILKVTGDGQEYKATVGESDNWTHIFTDLPKYDVNGKEINYTASEEKVNEEDMKFYTNDGVSGDMNTGYTITNTFTVPDEKTEVTVNKVWKDNSIQQNRRPEVVTINVIGENNKIVQSYDLKVREGETSHTFTNLPKYNSEGREINYTVEEVNNEDLKFYESSVSGDMNAGYTITNTFKVPQEETSVTVTKVWKDNNNEAKKRPNSIKLLLKRGAEVVGEQEVSSANKVDNNTWSYTFTGLNRYDSNGKEIVYTADETEINNNDLQFYNKNISGTTITNTFTQDTSTVEITVNKVWGDTEIQETRRPESVIIILKGNNVEVKRVELSGENQEDKDNWTYTFTNLPKYDNYNNIINYTVDEEAKNANDLKFYSKTIDGTTITNTFVKPTEKISIEVNKKWEDQENKYEKRPTSIKYQVKNGEEVVAEKVVTNKENWEYTFEGLDKYNEEGQEIAYTIDEQEVISGDLYYYEKELGEVVNKEGSTNEKEATITNKMVKIPSKVIVKYMDKYTKEEISDSKEKEGIIGEEFDVTEDVKEIPGYTLVEEPKEKTGTYTSEVQEKIYYYAKNTKVIVKYLEQDDTPEDNDNKVLSEQIEMAGYEGESYATNSEQIEGYTLVATKGNINGIMTKEEQIVVYYYAKNTKVIVKYLEKDNTPNDNSDNEVLLPEKTIEGYVGENYTTTEEIVPGYTLVEKPTNHEGIMTEDKIEVIYYYAKNTKVVVKYLEKDSTPDNNEDNIVLSDEVEISGYEGEEYTTEKKEIENYTFVEDTGNTRGTMTKEEIEVIYYYAQNTKAKVEHIDRETGEILKEESKDGKVGDLFTTNAEDFEGYVLVEAPEEPNIIMDKTGEQVVRYYYAHISAGVIEKHIDEITDELLYNENHEGNEGDPYNIPSKEFAGYDLVTDKIPDNSEGTMLRDEVIEVKYYYIKKATVVVKYIDEDTGEEITKEERIEGHENDSYETEAKDVENYDLVKTPENANGTMVITKNEDGTYNTEIEVIYYYKKIAGGVIENHIDIDTGKKLYTEEHKGNVGDEYNIPSKEFDGYDLVIEKLPENSKGKMTEEEIEVNYYYKKQAKVSIEYIDKETGEKLDEEEIKGHIGDSYETEEKEFDGYDLVEKPSNDKGEMKEEETIVKYYYSRKAEVEVKYLEKGTEYEVAEGSIINGYVGDNYETEQKEVPYYKFVEKTENWKGQMTQDKITVIYYYEKEVFNLGVDKWVSNVNINGIGATAQNKESKDEIYKVDIYRKDANTSNVKVTYTIRITNKGEIEGTVGKLTDIIPAGYSFNQEDNEIYFENNNGVLTTEDLKEEVIQPGEYKEIKVVLRWAGGEENFGQKDNMVILTQINNPAGYEDVDKEDNNDTSSMIITVATGLDRNDRIVIIGIVQIVLAITIGLLLSYKKKEKT